MSHLSAAASKNSNSVAPYQTPTSSTRTRQGGSCLRFGYKTFFIYRTCMRCAPARPVRTCIVRTCCAAVQEQDLRAATLQRNAKRRLSSHLTWHSSHPALHASHLHFTVPHFISSQIIWAILISCHLISAPHLIPSLLTCHLRKLFSTVFISPEH